MPEALVKLVAPVVASLGYELVGVEQHAGRGRPLVRIYIDAEAGITVDDCARVSRQVSAVFDVEDPISGPYQLEVSSPGLDRPLFTEEQCRRYVGSVVQVRIARTLAGRRKFRGILSGVSAQEIVIECEGERYTLPFDLIESARLAGDE
jgi:ribosome maturation factor RimP